MKKFLSVLLTCLIFSLPAVAQTTDILGKDLSYRQISAKLAEIEKMTKDEKVDVKQMTEEMSYFNDISLQITASRHQIEEEIKVIEKRIEALGIADENLPEAKVIALKRQEFNKELSAERTKLSEIDIVTAKIDELNRRIFDIRNKKMLGNLMSAEWKFYKPIVFFDVNKELVSLVLDMIASPYTWYQSLTEAERTQAKNDLMLFGVFVFFICLIGYILRRLIIKHLGYRQDIDAPRIGRKIVAALAVWCAYGIIPTAIIGFCIYQISNSDLISNDFFGLILKSLLYYLLYIIMGRASFRVVFTPYNEKWRLIKMETEKAKRMIRAIYATIELTGIFAFLLNIGFRENYPFELLSYILAIAASVKAVCIVWISHIYFAPKQYKDIEEEDPSFREEEGKAFRIGMFVSLFALVIVCLSVCGYSRLASYVVNQSILTMIVVGIFSILRRFIYEVLQRILLISLWVKTFRMKRLFLRKLSFWFGILVEPVLLLLLLSAILILWGVPVELIKNIAHKAVSGFMIGGVKVSLISIFWGIMAFALCLWVIKIVRFRIEFRLLENTNIDAGTKHSLASGFAYIGYALAVLLSFAIMGGNLTNIALIAGALSVGIGLGLQDIVNNFVSGIIMLIERPIKVGDWVVINGEEGQVKQINIRSTEVETFTRVSVIIPNATVLSNAVKNMTHQNNWARYTVSVGVAYGSDVELVKKVLLECAASHPKVIKKPAPYVLFTNFGASSLDFELRFYVSDIWGGWTAPSDLRFAINKRFEEEGIEIPFQQIVVHKGK